MNSDNQCRLEWNATESGVSQGLHYLPLIHQYLDTESCSELVLFKFKNKYGKEMRCPNT